MGLSEFAGGGGLDSLGDIVGDTSFALPVGLEVTEEVNELKAADSEIVDDAMLQI